MTMLRQTSTITFLYISTISGAGCFFMRLYSRSRTAIISRISSVIQALCLWYIPASVGPNESKAMLELVGLIFCAGMISFWQGLYRGLLDKLWIMEKGDICRGSKLEIEDCIGDKEAGVWNGAGGKYGGGNGSLDINVGMCGGSGGSGGKTPVPLDNGVIDIPLIGVFFGNSQNAIFCWVTADSECSGSECRLLPIPWRFSCQFDVVIDNGDAGLEHVDDVKPLSELKSSESNTLLTFTLICKPGE